MWVDALVRGLHWRAPPVAVVVVSSGGVGVGVGSMVGRVHGHPLLEIVAIEFPVDHFVAYLVHVVIGVYLLVSLGAGWGERGHARRLAPLPPAAHHQHNEEHYEEETHHNDGDGIAVGEGGCPVIVVVAGVLRGAEGEPVDAVPHPVAAVLHAVLIYAIGI